MTDTVTSFVVSGFEIGVTGQSHIEGIVRNASRSYLIIDFGLTLSYPDIALSMATELRTDKRGMVWAWGRSDPVPAVGGEGDARSVGFSRYLVAGSVSNPVHVPQLDQLELDDAIYLCIVIGNMMFYGWRKSQPQSEWLDAKQKAAERGYEFLADGGSIEDPCERYLRSTPYLVSGRFTRYAEGSRLALFSKG